MWPTMLACYYISTPPTFFEYFFVDLSMRISYDKNMRWFVVFFIGIVLSFSFRVYADSGFLSPVPDDPIIEMPLFVESAPTQSFGQILTLRLNVLGVSDEKFPEVTSTAALPVLAGASLLTISPTPLPSSTPAVIYRKTKKPTMTISIVGDSMVDTLGPGVGGLRNKLRATYPSTEFTVINHGVGQKTSIQDFTG